MDNPARVIFSCGLIRGFVSRPSPDTARAARPQLAVRDGIDAEQLVLARFVKATPVSDDIDRQRNDHVASHEGLGEPVKVRELSYPWVPRLSPVHIGQHIAASARCSGPPTSCKWGTIFPDTLEEPLLVRSYPRVARGTLKLSLRTRCARSSLSPHGPDVAVPSGLH